MTVHCDYCHRDAQLVTGAAIYPHRPDLFGKKFWRCEPCGAFVGCHDKGAWIPTSKGQIMSDGTLPLGRLANKELRKAKQRAHAAFDPLWRAKNMGRRKAYRMLAKKMGISEANCHIGMFDIDACNAVIYAVEQIRKELAI